MQDSSPANPDNPVEKLIADDRIAFATVIAFA